MGFLCMRIINGASSDISRRLRGALAFAAGGQHFVEYIVGRKRIEERRARTHLDEICDAAQAMPEVVPSKAAEEVHQHAVELLGPLHIDHVAAVIDNDHLSLGRNVLHRTAVALLALLAA